jgi:hypothetical protein
MQDLVIRLWPGLAAAMLLGLIVCATGRPIRPIGAARRLAAAIAITLLVAGAVLSVLQVLPGAVGLWLDSAVLHAAAYLAGCCLGALIGRARRGQSAPQQA